MNNFRLLTLIGAIFFIAVGIRAPLFTLYLEQTLGADYGRISLILSSYVALLLLVNYGWGRFSDWLGRRKPMIVGGLLFLAFTNLLLGQVTNVNWAWLVYLVEAVGVGAYNTLGRSPISITCLLSSCSALYSVSSVPSVQPKFRKRQRRKPIQRIRPMNQD